MRGIVAAVAVSGSLLGSSTAAQTGNVEVVKLCTSTISLIRDLSTAMDAMAKNDRNEAEAIYDRAMDNHYDDWMSFSLVLGGHAQKVLANPGTMGTILVSAEDCIKGQVCRMDEFRASSTEVWSKLPLACQADYQGT